MCFIFKVNLRICFCIIFQTVILKYYDNKQANFYHVTFPLQFESMFYGIFNKTFAKLKAFFYFNTTILKCVLLAN